MSQTTEAQTTQPTSEEVIGKVNESIAALQDAQKTVVEGAQLLAAHVNDPTAHGAAIPEVVEQQLPIPVMEGTSLKWEKKDGTIIAGPVDLKGAPGQDGVDGDTGPRPEHRWEGTKLLVQNSDGSWPAEGVDLKGEKGDTGQVEGLSDAVDSNSSTTPASSKAVKTAYDKAVSAQETADAADSKAQAAQNAAQAAQTTAENIGIFSGSTSGLVPASDGDATKVLLGDGTWGSAVSADDGAAAMTISEDLLLTANSPRTLVLTASASGMSVRLPDPATLPEGTTFHIIVRPLEDIQLCDFSGHPIKAYPVLSVSAAIRVQLVDASTGLWALSEYKSGSASDAEGTPGLHVGDLTIFSNSSSYYSNKISVIALSDTRAIVCYTKSSPCVIFACVLTISGTAISLGEEQEISVRGSTTEELINMTFTALSDTKALLCSYVRGETESKVQLITISGTTISAGEEQTLEPSGSNLMSAVAISETFAIVCYRLETSPYRGFLRAISISGATVSVGSATQLSSKQVYNPLITALSETKAIFRYTYSGDNTPKARILTISGTNVSVGEEQTYSSADIGSSYFIALSETRVLEISNGGKARILTISGTTISAGEENILFSENIVILSATALSESKVLLVYNDNSDNSYAKFSFLTILETTVNSSEGIYLNQGKFNSCSLASIKNNSVVMSFFNNSYTGMAGVISVY